MKFGRGSRQGENLKRRGVLTLLILVSLSQVLLACGIDQSQPSPQSSQTSLATAVSQPPPTVPPTVTPATISVTQPSSATPTKCPDIAADPIPYSVDQLIKSSDNIFLGEITAVEPFVWNTPDGQTSPNLCSIHYYQLAPVEIAVKESFKGGLQPGASMTVLVPDAPGSLPNILPIRTEIIVGAEFIWFLGKTENFRPENPQKPLYYPTVWGQFFQEERDNDWSELHTRVSFPDTAFLKQHIANPPPPTK